MKSKVDKWEDMWLAAFKESPMGIEQGETINTIITGNINKARTTQEKAMRSVYNENSNELYAEGIGLAQAARNEKHLCVHVTGTDYASALSDMEAVIYEAAYAAARYNQSKAARSLGVSRGTFRTKLREHFGSKYISLAEHLYNGPELNDN